MHNTRIKHYRTLSLHNNLNGATHCVCHSFSWYASHSICGFASSEYNSDARRTERISNSREPLRMDECVCFPVGDAFRILCRWRLYALKRDMFNNRGSKDQPNRLIRYTYAFVVWPKYSGSCIVWIKSAPCTRANVKRKLYTNMYSPAEKPISIGRDSMQMGMVVCLYGVPLGPMSIDHLHGFTSKGGESNTKHKHIT